MRAKQRYKAWGEGAAASLMLFVGDNAVRGCFVIPRNSREGLRIVCIREVQKTLKESAKRAYRRQAIEIRAWRAWMGSRYRNDGQDNQDPWGWVNDIPRHGTF